MPKLFASQMEAPGGFISRHEGAKESRGPAAPGTYERPIHLYAKAQEFSNFSFSMCCW